MRDFEAWAAGVLEGMDKRFEKLENGVLRAEINIRGLTDSVMMHQGMIEAILRKLEMEDDPYGIDKEEADE